MADMKITVTKGIETAIMTAIATGITEALAAALAQAGIHADNATIKLSVIALLTGLCQSAHNWYSHRKA
jgi:hypothetical protein